MKICDLIENSDCYDEVNGIEFDCNKIVSGNIFVALVGSNFDGHNFVVDAYNRGATVGIVERKVECDIKQIVVKNTRIALSQISKQFYNNFCDTVPIIAITGTNGKTTTSHALSTILSQNGYNPCVIGTNGVYFDGKRSDCDLTTPDPPQLHKIIYDAVNMGATHIIMEASAHALELDKLYGINFSVGAFTNFTQDHLDYFGNMGNYYRAKCKLAKMCKTFVMNCDDEKVMAIYSGNETTFGRNLNATVCICGVKCHDYGTIFNLKYNGEIKQVETALMGEFNAYNLSCAVAMAIELGIDFSSACEGVSKQGKVDGRFNIYNLKSGKAIIDFAHTEDGLENLLLNARYLCDGRLILVFGCGGNRDKSKREKMGIVAGRLSDIVVLTNDNPRFENPLDIICEIEKGIKQTDLGNYYTVLNRQDAINFAYNSMKNGDILVIAGKGAEKYQEINGVKYPFNDADALNTAIKGCENG